MGEGLEALKTFANAASWGWGLGVGRLETDACESMSSLATDLDGV